MGLLVSFSWNTNAKCGRDGQDVFFLCRNPEGLEASQKGVLVRGQQIVQKAQKQLRMCLEKVKLISPLKVLLSS